MSDIEEEEPIPVYISPYNLEYFLEHFEDVCPEDFEGFTQQHFDRIGNMFFAPIKPEKSSALSTDKITCECGSTINKSSMKSHIKTKKHLLHQASASAAFAAFATSSISLETHPASPLVETSPA